MDLIVTDKETLAQTQHVERLMLSASEGNTALSPMINEEIHDETNLMDQYDTII